MKAVKLSILAGVLTLALSATSFAQATQPPKPTTTPPATQPPAMVTPKPAPEPPAPFPQDAKIAFVDIQAIASTSAAGREASAKLKALNDKKMAELQDENKQLQTMTAKRDQGGGVLNDAARAQLDKDIEQLQRKVQFDQQSDQAEWNDLNNELQASFQKQLMPIIKKLGEEKGLHAIFSSQDAGSLYIHPGLDLTQEVIKRLDAAATAAGKKN
ncbi:MAG TPA: OmpH family outer membrane protein [Vicinamibacterales bacterium]